MLLPDVIQLTFVEEENYISSAFILIHCSNYLSYVFCNPISNFLNKICVKINLKVSCLRKISHNKLINFHFDNHKLKFMFFKSV